MLFWCQNFIKCLFSLFAEESWKLPTFAGNIAKMFKWVMCQINRTFIVSGGRDIFLDNMKKLIYLNDSKNFFNPRPLL